MEAAVESVKGGKGLQEASRLYNVPVEFKKKGYRSGEDGLLTRSCNSANEE